MQAMIITTPFGRRPMSLNLLDAQVAATRIEPGKSVDKWKTYRDACEARSLLGLRDRALAVLNALLSFHPHHDLCEGTNLIVFPSNAQLSARANGIAGTTLRENLSYLITAGLISRVDSPNGKRYAHRKRNGDIETAYGFNLAPLLQRADEIQRLAEEVAEERRYLKLTKDRISILRRDTRKLIAATATSNPDLDIDTFELRYSDIMSELAASKLLANLEYTLERLKGLHRDLINLLQNRVILTKSAGNDAADRCHKQNSESESHIEIEATPPHENAPCYEMSSTSLAIRQPTYSLDTVLKACPQIHDYGRKGLISSWTELIQAATVVKSMLGISTSAYTGACRVMGPENAAIVISYILERADQITSAGGYLRGLTEKASRSHLNITPMLTSLTRRNTETNVSERRTAVETDSRHCVESFQQPARAGLQLKSSPLLRTGAGDRRQRYGIIPSAGVL